jgi:hypothetical protein
LRSPSTVIAPSAAASLIATQPLDAPHYRKTTLGERFDVRVGTAERARQDSNL